MTSFQGCQAADIHLSCPAVALAWLQGVGAARAVGDACDAFVNGGWWEMARVVELQVAACSDCINVALIASNACLGCCHMEPKAAAAGWCELPGWLV